MARAEPLVPTVEVLVRTTGALRPVLAAVAAVAVRILRAARPKVGEVELVVVMVGVVEVEGLPVMARTILAMAALEGALESQAVEGVPQLATLSEGMEVMPAALVEIQVMQLSQEGRLAAAPQQVAAAGVTQRMRIAAVRAGVVVGSTVIRLWLTYSLAQEVEAEVTLRKPQATAGTEATEVESSSLSLIRSQ